MRPAIGAARLAAFLVFERLPAQHAPGYADEHSGRGWMQTAEAKFRPFRNVCMLDADDADDALEQATVLTGKLGEYIAVEGKAVSLEMVRRAERRNQ